MLSLSACQKAAVVADAPREVVVLPAQVDGKADVLTLPGEVQSRFVTPMSFRIAGQVIERRVHLGDSVRKGDVVARLDPADADHNAAGAEAELASAREHYDAAEKQFQRDTRQAQDKLISALQLEQTQDAYAAAKAQLKSAQARAAVAGNQRSYTGLIAEHDGVISAEQANTGEVLAAGQPVFSLAWSGATDVTTEVSESQVAKIRVGAPATIRLTAMPDRTLNGRVREVSPAADPQSRTYRVKVTLETQDPALRLGMSGEVAINTSASAAVSSQASQQNKNPATATVIPATALFHQGNRPAVWIVRPADSKLELRPVTVSAYGERSVTLSDGIATGEKIVVQGVHTLTAGEQVKAIAPLHAEDFAL
ncbi:efflux RND transporter periplasmic adaptor subunit [Herbaspirillum sp. RV1423]|uniref:efflux RND transporter periplasmic adaptor subunit n=1 Tax=Herbaspirillum sp. RV1423 TaxID=1443993 RepID=UPI000558CF09|nr:efflux RND transporter periplasmic adaptor subunit [Herbaspirillum sp. RV1423]